MASASIPADRYTEIRVTLLNTLQLVSLDGATTTEAKFAAMGADFTWSLRNLRWDSDTTGQVVLDFNLAGALGTIAMLKGA